MGYVGACWDNEEVERFLEALSMIGYLKFTDQRVNIWQKMWRLYEALQL
jgi:hypothetical protein